jgi:hypothetical protein
MPKLLSILLVLVNVAALSACADRHEGDLKSYLMQHPRVLTREVTQCQQADTSDQPTPRCKTVLEAAGEVMTLIEAHQRNPQAFGQRILDAQMQLAKTGQNGDEVKTLLAVVGLNSPE